jgi:CDP-diacylglycerol---glycerol-3-phosphate 3-phosphatidyltransferase
MSPARPDPVQDPVSPTAGLWNLPNVLTMLRILLVPVFAWLLLREGGYDTPSRWWAAAVFIIASATDWFDGYFARKWNIVTTFGKIADPISDKALTGVALIGLSVLGELPWWATIVILVREIGITLMRFWVIRVGVVPAGRGGKVKTAFQMLAITMYLFPLGPEWESLCFWILLVAVFLTVATGLDYVVQIITMKRRADREKQQAA